MSTPAITAQFITPRASTVLVGDDQSYAEPIGIQIAADVLSAGGYVVQLVPREADALTRHIRAYLLEFDTDNIAALQRLHVANDPRFFYVPSDVRHALPDDASPVLVWRPQITTSAHELQDQWLPLAQAAAHAMPDAALLTTFSWGSPQLPPPALNGFAADMIWRCRSFHDHQVTVGNPLTGAEMKLRAKASNGSLCFEEVETLHV